MCHIHLKLLFWVYLGVSLGLRDPRYLVLDLLDVLHDLLCLILLLCFMSCMYVILCVTWRALPHLISNSLIHVT